jgi:hypothetical protein
MLKAINFTAGINRESTTYAASGGWFDSDNMRFRSGSAEKIGGWIRLSAQQYLGTCRSLWNWIDFDGDNYLGLGTNLKYYIELGGTYFDVTPIRYTFTHLLPTVGATDNCFATTDTHSIVTVNITSHGAHTDDFVTFSGAAAVGGIPAATLNLEYQVTVIDGNSFTIETGVAATSTVAAGGGTTISAAFQINTGSNTYIFGLGWGAGGWGRGGWGSAASVGIEGNLGLWSQDNFGQDLVLAPRNGGIYYWQDALGVGVRAQLLNTLSTTAGFSGAYVPTQTLQVLASGVQRFVIAMGANGYSPGAPNNLFDPMMVRWSDQSNPYQWIPSIINQAGEYRLSHGSTIIMAQLTRQEILIWTDTTLYSMQYLGTSYVWGFNVLMDNISIVSPNAAITANNATYWMGREKFFIYTGRVETLNCTLKQYVFEDINMDQAYQVFAGLNSGFNEIWWFYCSKYATVVDRYVAYNYVENVWFAGSMSRSAWLDSGIRMHPIAADYNNRLLYHETTCDDGSGTEPVAIPAYIQSADFDIEDGHHFGFVWRILPDINFNGSSANNPYVTIEVQPRVNSGTAYGVADNPTVVSAQDYRPPNPSVYVIQQFTGQVYTRLRGRQMAIKLASDALGVAWTVGTNRIDLRPDARR